MDFHSLAAAQLPLVRRSTPDPAGEDKYYRSCPDLSARVPRAIAGVAVAAGALVVLLVTLGPA